MARKYKLIVGTSIDRLEWLVNEFLHKAESDGFDFVGPPQVFGHEQYVQPMASERTYVLDINKEEDTL